MNKKSLILCCCLFILTGCKTTESAYRLAYEKAVSNNGTAINATPVAQTTPAVAQAEPVSDKAPAATVVETPVEDVSVRSEFVKTVTGTDDLNHFNVVCGSFGLKTNADALCSTLTEQGYSARVVYNEGARTYRVICATADTKAAAVEAMNAFRKRFSDNQDFQKSWILYKRDDR